MVMLCVTSISKFDWREMLHLSTLCDDTWQLRLVIGPTGDVLDFTHDEESIAEDSTEDGVLVVEPGTFGAGDEELRGRR